MKAKLTFMAGLAVGYVAGTRAGRRGYENLKNNARAVWETDQVQKTVQKFQGSIKEEAKHLGSRLVHKVSGSKESTADGKAAVSDVE